METAAMLCDYAEVAGNKLFVTGAGINLISAQAPEGPFAVQLSLALLLTVPWAETEASHKLTVELVSDGGTGSERVPLGPLPPGGDPADDGLLVAEFTVGRSDQMRPGDDVLVPFAVPLMGLPLPRGGDYFFAVRIDGTESARMSFRLMVPVPPPSGGSGPTAW